MLRFLAPNRQSRSSSPAPSSSRSRSRQPELQPRLTIRVPSYGSVFMDASHQGSSDSHDPTVPPEAGPSTHRTDRESRGELEVEIPQGMGRVRVKAIRVGMRTETELTLGEGRVKEKDVIFERKVEVRGGNAEGIILEEGVQRFDFVLLIPSNLCSHDKHPNGRINHFLYGELEGLADSRTTSRSQTRMSTRSATPRSGRSKSPMPGSSGGTATPRSPVEGDESAVNPASLASALSMSITRQEGLELMPPAPPYEAAQEREATWLRGNVRKERYIELLYNCQPEGGVTELDVTIRDAVPGLGPFEVQLESDCWTIGGLLTGKLSLPAPGSNITLFSFRVSLIQTHTIISPRDDPATAEPNVTTQTYPIFTIGTRPAAGDKNPGLRAPALWRGVDAKGTRTGEIELKAHGRNPADTLARPSSVPNVPTPITVTHRLAIEVLFSVWAEDETGRTLPMGGPGAVRALMIKKNTVVASCAFTPEELRLPSYGLNERALTADGSVVHEDAFSRLARKCPLCGREPYEKLCQTCPPSSIPHPRHDHPAKLVGNERGVCPLCAEEVMPRREPNFEDCACGMDTAYLVERMEKRQRGTSAGGRAGDSRLEGGVLVKGMSDLSVGDV